MNLNGDICSSGGCSKCICNTCLMWWSGRCPYGGCYDHYRAQAEPWPGETRTGWTNWNKPGEQAYWCRGGIFYATAYCDHYVEYDESRTLIKTCLLENVHVFQDGYIKCGLVDVLGCQECYSRFEEKLENEED